MNSKHQKLIKITNEMLASKEKRFANFILDYIFRLVIITTLGIIFGVVMSFMGNDEFLVWAENMDKLEEYAISFLSLFLYYFVFEASTGRTLGKYITNTKVLMKNGNKPEANTILLRTLSRIVPFDGLSFLGEIGKGWHDKWTDTVVVDLKKYNELSKMQLSISEIGIKENE